MDYLTQKWKLWYKSLDVNLDGKISLEDVEESRNKFTELHHLFGDKADSVKTDMKNWWTTYILNGKDQLSEEQFISSVTAAYEKDKEDFKANIQKCFETIFEVIDTNKDGSIDLNQFILIFKAFGHNKEDPVREAFEVFDKKWVPVREMVTAWVQFVTEEDSTKRDVMREVLESVV